MNATFLKMQVGVGNAMGAMRSGAGRVIRRLVKDERGVSVIEYAILLGVIVAATAVAVSQFGDQIQDAINTVAGNVTSTVSTIGTT